MDFADCKFTVPFGMLLYLPFFFFLAVGPRGWIGLGFDLSGKNIVGGALFHWEAHSRCVSLVVVRETFNVSLLSMPRSVTHLSW